jgi:cytochrome c biogenesis protein CcmG/thiol:disulfide interchange protein DsbE
MRNAGRIFAVLAAALFVALLAYGVLRKSDDTSIDDALQRSETIAAPQFELPLLEAGRLGEQLAVTLKGQLTDGRIDLKELRGTPVVINVWASWCVPCGEEAPVLERGWQVAKRSGVLVLGLDMQDVTDDARDFIREHHITYPSVRDRGNTVARRYGVTGVPETFFVSARGQVVGHVVGVVSAQQMRDGLAAARGGDRLGVQAGGEQRPTR